MAELSGRPIGAMQIIDPRTEQTHYWGEGEPNLRAIDIWIGAASDLGKGYGQTMMRRAFQICFADPGVTAIIIDPSQATCARINSTSVLDFFLRDGAFSARTIASYTASRGHSCL